SSAWSRRNTLAPLPKGTGPVHCEEAAPTSSSSPAGAESTPAPPGLPADTAWPQRSPSATNALRCMPASAARCLRRDLGAAGEPRTARQARSRVRSVFSASAAPVLGRIFRFRDGYSCSGTADPILGPLFRFWDRRSDSGTDIPVLGP